MTPYIGGGVGASKLDIDNIIVDGTLMDNLLLGDDTLISNEEKSEIENILNLMERLASFFH